MYMYIHIWPLLMEELYSNSSLCATTRRYIAYTKSLAGARTHIMNPRRMNDWVNFGFQHKNPGFAIRFWYFIINIYIYIYIYTHLNYIFFYMQIYIHSTVMPHSCTFILSYSWRVKLTSFYNGLISKRMRTHKQNDWVSQYEAHFVNCITYST